jgi:uncharacterized membrane protein YjgN (DUF898 family)
VSRKWIAICAIYGVLLVLGAILIAFEDDASAGTKLIELGVFVGGPAIVFAASAAPLWRESRSRPALLAAGILAVAAALVLVVITWGVALPLSACLVALAIADFDRAAVLSGLQPHRRVLGFATAFVVSGFALGLAMPVAAVLAVAGLAVIVWRLASRRAILPPAHDSGPFDRSGP